MLSKVTSAGLYGADGVLICCEADVSDGLPGILMIGYLAPEVREAAERVRTAVQNSGLRMEPRKVTINLSPADIRKEGCGHDLAIAVSYLRSGGRIRGSLCDALIGESVFLGELSLSGRILPLKGILPMTAAAREAGFRRIFVPQENAAEAAAIEGMEVCGVSGLEEIVRMLNGEVPLPAAVPGLPPEPPESEKDFSEIAGQELVKRAAVIAVCGMHNFLMIGPAGTGKSMIAARIPTILPDMTREEQLQVSKLYSVCGMLPGGHALMTRRPFRSPHHTITPQAMSGGGAHPRPGEVSLASGGVLFLDELAEFRSSTLEVLRQPMEEKKITVSRIRGTVEYPADFILCAATNPCRCGFYPDRSRCSCTPAQVRSYLGRISKPLLDRIDICVATEPPSFGDLKNASGGEPSSRIRETVGRIQEIQRKRLAAAGIRYNGQMTPAMIREFCPLSPEDDRFLREVYEKKRMSARSLHKVMRVARTIADLEGSEKIRREHLAEALGYRLTEEIYWGGGADGRSDQTAER